MQTLIVSVLIAAAALYPEPQMMAIEDVTFQRWTGGSIKDPEIAYIYNRGGDPSFEQNSAIEVSRVNKRVRYCERVDFSRLDPCVNAKRLR